MVGPLVLPCMCQICAEILHMSMRIAVATKVHCCYCLVWCWHSDHVSWQVFEQFVCIVLAKRKDFIFILCTLRIVLTRDRTDRILALTYDVDLQSRVSQSCPIDVQKIKVSCHLVQKTRVEINRRTNGQRDGANCITFLANMVGNYLSA